MSKGWHGGASSPALVRQSRSNVSIPLGDFFLLPDFETREELYYPDVPFLWQEQQEETQANNDDGNYSDTVEHNFTCVVVNNCVRHWTGVITWDKALGQYPFPPRHLPSSEGWLGGAGEHDHGGDGGRETALPAGLAHSRVRPQSELSCGLRLQTGVMPGAAAVVCSSIVSVACRWHRNPRWGPGKQRKGHFPSPAQQLLLADFFCSPCLSRWVRSPAHPEPCTHAGGDHTARYQSLPGQPAVPSCACMQSAKSWELPPAAVQHAGF